MEGLTPTLRTLLPAILLHCPVQLFPIRRLQVGDQRWDGHQQALDIIFRAAHGGAVAICRHALQKSVGLADRCYRRIWQDHRDLNRFVWTWRRLSRQRTCATQPVYIMACKHLSWFLGTGIELRQVLDEQVRVFSNNQDVIKSEMAVVWYTAQTAPESHLPAEPGRVIDYSG